MTKLICKKLGMTQIFDESGNVVPVTVLEAGPCVVTQLKTKENDGYDAIQVGFGKAKKLSKPMKGHLKELTPSILQEFRIEKTEEYKVGQELKADVFKVGNELSVTGKTIGKGFAGTIKRWNFSRGLMSHGSKSHRRPGSIGAGTTPGRVLKGTKMAGRLGNVQVTKKGLTVIKVEVEKNLILVKGSIPGKPGNVVVLNKVAEGKTVEPKKDKKAEEKKGK
jgi:large subunit ribosomal protein L3